VGVVKSRLSPETLQLYARAWVRFARFCAEHGRAAFPASPDMVSAFLVQSGAGRAALARYLAAIDHKHRQHGLAPPGQNRGLRAALRSARRAAPPAGRRSAPTPAYLHKLAQSCPGDLAGRRDRALLLLAATGLGRTALVGLQAEQLRFTERAVTCVVAGSESTRQIEVPRSAALASCPVRALEDWLRVSATRYGPVFRKVNRWGQIEHAALGTDAVRLILARRTAELR
jgi:site-specific recombinase XerC